MLYALPGHLGVDQDLLVVLDLEGKDGFQGNTGRTTIRNSKPLPHLQDHLLLLPPTLSLSLRLTPSLLPSFPLLSSLLV